MNANKLITVKSHMLIRSNNKRSTWPAEICRPVWPSDPL